MKPKDELPVAAGLLGADNGEQREGVSRSPAGALGAEVRRVALRIYIALWIVILLPVWLLLTFGIAIGDICRIAYEKLDALAAEERRGSPAPNDRTEPRT